LWGDLKGVFSLLDKIVETMPHLWYYELTGFVGKRNYLLMHIRKKKGY
jgi:hypothetical protein